MVTYEFLKPSCYDYNLTDLENLREQGVIDYYEFLEGNNKLIFYWRGMKPNEQKNFQFSLNKRYMLNNCKERTHSAYLYYDKKGTVQYRRADN